MAEELEQEEQVQIVQSPVAVITILALALLFLGAIVFFGYQTWIFVNWILPEDSLAMKVLAVVNFDVFSYVWLATSLFLARWIQPFTRTITGIAGVVTFLLSLGCSVIQLMIASAERFGQNTNPDLVYTADAFIVIALVWNICTLLGVVHIQWPYISGYHPPEKAKRGWFWQKHRTHVQPGLLPGETYKEAIAKLERNQQILLDRLEQMSKAQQNGHAATNDAFSNSQQK